MSCLPTVTRSLDLRLTSMTWCTISRHRPFGKIEGECGGSTIPRLPAHKRQEHVSVRQANHNTNYTSTADSMGTQKDAFFTNHLQAPPKMGATVSNAYANNILFSH